MIKAAVLGSPISHSLSPLLHNHAYSVLGIAGEYSAIEVKHGELAKFLSREAKNGFNGFSLTMPLKEDVIELGIQVSAQAQRIRSANTIIFTGGEAQASSTDLTAFQRLIPVTALSRVSVIGAGGTARALLGALDGKVPQLELFVRSTSKAQGLAAALDSTELIVKDISELSADVLSNRDWLISTVPAGVTDSFAEEISQAKIDLSGLKFCEVLYNPWPTDLLLAMKSSGSSTLDGLDLLVEQALDQIQLMTGLSFDYTSMREELLKVGLKALHRD